MQILDQDKDISQFLGNFSVSIAADQASWQKWCGLIICVEEEKDKGLQPEMHAHISHICRAALIGKDGIILQLGNNTVFVITQELDKDSLQTVQSDINELAVGRWSILTFRSFNITDEVDTVEEFAAHYANDYHRLNTGDTIEFATLKKMVPHISELLKAWMTTSKSRARHEKPHLLLVDDDAMTRHIIAYALKGDYPMVTAANVPEAIEKHLLLAPDIVFLDIDLAGTDGFMLLNYIRAYDPGCRVVMFSGNSYLDNRIKAYAAGAVGFVGKPFNRKSFERYIDMCKPQQLAANI